MHRTEQSSPELLSVAVVPGEYGLVVFSVQGPTGQLLRGCGSRCIHSGTHEHSLPTHFLVVGLFIRKVEIDWQVSKKNSVFKAGLKSGSSGAERGFFFPFPDACKDPKELECKLALGPSCTLPEIHVDAALGPNSLATAGGSRCGSLRCYRELPRRTLIHCQPMPDVAVDLFPPLSGGNFYKIHHDGVIFVLF